MKILTMAVTMTVALLISQASQAASMESIEARVGLGSTADTQGFAGFFENGFVQGSTSHTETLSFDDGVVQVDFDITVEGLDENAAAAGLRTTNSAVGVDGPGDSATDSTRIDSGESIKVTINDVAYSVIGPPPAGMTVDQGSFEALISSIRFAAFDSGVDTYTYTGLGAAAVTGDDTNNIKFVPTQTITNGDMFTITADSGAFRGLYISMAGNYNTIVPEPTALSLILISLAGVVLKRRK